MSATEVQRAPDTALLEDDGASQIRLERTRSFVLTHWALSGLAVLAVSLEWGFGLGQNEKQLKISLIIACTALFVTAVVELLFRRRIGLSYLIPATLFVDTIIMMLQMYQEGDIETGWIATPILLIVMLPLFSDRPRLVWLLAALQIGMMYLFMWLRTNEIWVYSLRTDDFIGDWDNSMFSLVGFTITVVGSAMLAGRTSVDVLNSQRQLDEALKRQERELAIANARIIQQQKLLSVEQLTAGIVHEINNPLTFVRTNLTSLSRDIADILRLLTLYAEVDGHLERIDPDTAEEIRELRDILCLDDPESALTELLNDAGDGVDRVQGIIRDLRIFSRLDEAERKPVRLSEGIESTLKIIRPQLDQRAISIEIVPSDLPQIDIFPALLNQVVMNLLQNAYDAVGQGGRIRVSMGAEADAQYILVEDDGPGVPDEIVAQIFDPFFTTKTVGEGTGLGLSLSMDIVRKHGGRLDVERSETLGGAAFRLRLPLDVEQELAGDQVANK